MAKASNSESYEECFSTALKILQRAAQTESKMREKLSRRMFESEIIERTIVRLKEIKLIDDEKYARDYISYRSRTTPLGSRYLKLKLMQRGISPSVAKEASSEILPEDEYRLAMKAGEKRLSQLARFDQAQRKVKLVRFLLSRGFSGSAVMKVAKELIDLSQ